MDRNLVSAQEHEIEYLARKYGISVEQVKAVIGRTRSRSREEIEKALDSEFSQQGNPT